MIWGNSGNGKTDFCIKLAKYLCKFTKVVYNTLEEGVSESIKQALIRNKMDEQDGQFVIVDGEPINELLKRLTKHKAPKAVIIDSFQYTGLNKKTYKEFKKQLPKTLIIFISHAEGKHPEGRSAKSVRYDANVKIQVEGFRANAVSRYGGGKPYTIWAEKAKEFYGDID
ncbi:MAG: hypothetical protein ACPGSD_07895 [Flavobacteriales bacterium]